jgi:serine/threonine protein kinase
MSVAAIEFSADEFGYTNILSSGEYDISFNDLVKDATHPKCIRAYSDALRKTVVFKFHETIGEGSLGSVYAYVSEATKESLALKITDVYSEAASIDESHHQTESQAPARLREEQLESCRSCFVKTFVPHEKSMNAYIRNRPRSRVEGYTQGTENPMLLIKDFKEHGKTEEMLEDRLKLLISKPWETIIVHMYTVMELAKGSLYGHTVGMSHEKAEETFTRVINACDCLLEHGYYYKDLKLDQVLVMPDNTLKLGDLGNLCKVGDNCEMGLFDDPDLWVWITPNNVGGRWKTIAQSKCKTRDQEMFCTRDKLLPEEIEHALQWQRAMFVCEIVCASIADDEERKSVYNLSPHSWMTTIPIEIKQKFQDMIKLLVKRRDAIYWYNSGNTNRLNFYDGIGNAIAIIDKFLTNRHFPKMTKPNLNKVHHSSKLVTKWDPLLKKFYYPE